MGTRDVYMAEGQFPESVQLVPEYVGGIVDYLNTTENGADAEPLTTPDADETVAADGVAAGGQGHHPARAVRRRSTPTRSS